MSVPGKLYKYQPFSTLSLSNLRFLRFSLLT
jgi:hypothetical protein